MLLYHGTRTLQSITFIYISDMLWWRFGWYLKLIMFNWLFRYKRKKAAADHEAELKAKLADRFEAELKAKLADRLKNYIADEDISVSNFSGVNFNENDEKTTGKKDGVRNVDAWGQANPSETGKWNKDEKRQISRRQAKRRRGDRRK